MRKSMLLIAALVFTGCGTDGQGNQDGSVRNRQNDALKDPFSYGPSNQKTPAEPGPFKEGTTKSEWDRFWNP